VVQKQVSTRWSPSFAAMKSRTSTWLLATLILALLVPVTPANANGDRTISLFPIAGVTPPVPGEAPDQVIDETDEYTGTISWESIDGPLPGNFETETIYAANIELTVKTGFTFSGVNEDSYEVDGAFKVINDTDSGSITAFFAPPLLDVTQSLDESFGAESFGEEGSIAIRDIFGDAPIDSSGTVVGPVKIDRIAVDSQNRIVVLASFYNVNNQITEITGSIGTAIGTGYRNSLNITAQPGNTIWDSAAELARNYVSTVGDAVKADWYLPAKDELNELHKERSWVDEMSGPYWSSSQSGASTAWSQNFSDNGEPSELEKSEQYSVRPIRAGKSVNPIPKPGDTGEGGGVIFYVDEDGTFDCGPDLSEHCNYLEAAPTNWNGVTEDPSRTWVTDYEHDNHILFRLSPGGSYDPEFGDPELLQYLRIDVEDEDLKPYALVTTTCGGYTERLDIAIDSEDGILVLLSGSAEEDTCQDDFHNFVARFTATGVLDSTFGDDSDGAIGTLNSQEGPADTLFTKLTIDARGRIIVAALSEEDSAQVEVKRFSQTGALDTSFGATGTTLINMFRPDANSWLSYRSISMIANDGSYIIGFLGAADTTGPPFVFTQLVRLGQNGTLDQSFKPSGGLSYDEDSFVLPYVFLADLAPDSETGFLMSATSYLPMGGEGGFFETASSALFRIQMDGDFDAEFMGTPGIPYLSPFFSDGCLNSGLLRSYSSHQSSDGIVLGNSCGDGDGEEPSDGDGEEPSDGDGEEPSDGDGEEPSDGDGEEPREKFKLFSLEGVFQGQYLVDANPEPVWQVTNQLIRTSNNKVVVLSGARPTTGIFGFMEDFVGFFDDADWTQSRITRYVFSDLFTPPSPAPLTITASTSVVNAQVGVAITPVGLTIAGGTFPDVGLSWDRELPTGLNYVGGQITGTPTVAQTITIEFLVVDLMLETATTTVQFVISLANQRPSTTSPSRVTGTVGTALGNSVTLSLDGATSSETVTVTSGYALPAGLSLATNGRVTGTPSAAGTTSTRLTFTNTQSETATALVEFVFSPAPTTPAPPVVVYVAPTPVPYLKTLTKPKLNLKDGKLICTPGTYNAGYTLDGVVQGSTTALFTPSSFTYNLLINGITQTSLTVTTAVSTASWNLPTAPSGAMISCSVTVSANGVTNTDKSSDNTSAVSSALSTQALAISEANTDYSMSQTAISKAYQKALVDNRANWRAEIAAIRSNYYDTVAQIDAQPKTTASNKKMIADKSTALKVMIAAQKKSAADYRASKPALAATRDAANKAALDSKNTAIAKANATYGTFIESIGYGVLIP
jgi:hypothetical protein